MRQMCSQCKVSLALFLCFSCLVIWRPKMCHPRCCRRSMSWSSAPAPPTLSSVMCPDFTPSESLGVPHWRHRPDREAALLRTRSEMALRGSATKSPQPCYPNNKYLNGALSLLIMKCIKYSRCQFSSLLTAYCHSLYFIGPCLYFKEEKHQCQIFVSFSITFLVWNCSIDPYRQRKTSLSRFLQGRTLSPPACRSRSRSRLGWLASRLERVSCSLLTSEMGGNLAFRLSPHHESVDIFFL